MLWMLSLKKIVLIFAEDWPVIATLSLTNGETPSGDNGNINDDY